MSKFSEFRSRLSDVGITAGDLIFVHSSVDWLGGGIETGIAVIEALLDLVGNQGTVCMPSYTWRYPQSLGPAVGEVIDLRRSPAKVGIIPEVFRRWPGVRRSASYWLPICAHGADSDALLQNQQLIVDPFGPGSTLHRFLELNGKVVGIGVNLGSASLSHLPDHFLAPYYSIDIYNSDLLEGDVIAADGQVFHVKNITLKRKVFESYTPSALFGVSETLRRQLNFDRWGHAYVSVYPIKSYVEEALFIGREYLITSMLPPWFNGAKWLPPGF